MKWTCPHCGPHNGATLDWTQDQTLHCSVCKRTWPSLRVDSAALPVILPDVAASWALADKVKELLNHPSLLASWQLGDATERALAGGLLTYAPAHFGHRAELPLPTVDLAWLPASLPANLPGGAIALLGCGTGGEAIALVDHPALADRDIVLLDANLASLAWARWLAQAGAMQMPFRTSAATIGWAEVYAQPAEMSLLQRSHWVCADALQPPMSPEGCAAVVTIGLLDSVADPLVLIQQVTALLRPGGVWVLATPWNWQADVTPHERQLHHLTTDIQGLLTGRVLAGVGEGMAVQAHWPDVPWRLTVHPRYTANFSMEVMVLRKSNSTGVDRDPHGST